MNQQQERHWENIYQHIGYRDYTYYKFAGVEICISVPEKWMYEDDKSLNNFRVEKVEDAHHFQFEIVDRLDKPEGEILAHFPDYCVYSRNGEKVRYIGNVTDGWENAYIRAAHRGKQHDVQLKFGEFTNKIGIKSVLNALEAEHLVLEERGVIFHCSYIEWNGKAILFTAPSGTGKSTQADLWHKYRGTKIVNGDRAAVRMVDGNVYAAGIPFSGSSDYCESLTLPVEAIVYLEQNATTEIKMLNGISAFRKVWEGCTVNTWDKNDLDRAADIVEHIVRSIPIYHLACTPDESAVLALEKVLNQQP